MKDEVTELLSKLVTFDTSINPAQNIYPSNDCAKFVKAFGEQHGYSILEVPDCKFDSNPIYPVILYKQGKEEGPTVLFLGHLDVVPVTTAELQDWDFPPFEGTTKGDHLYGRGAADMKAGVTAFLLAFKNNPPTKGTVIIALSGDEEIGGTASVPKIIDKLETASLTPDYVVNAEGSGYPALVTRRRGSTQVTFSFQLDPQHAKGMPVQRTFSSYLADKSKSLHSMSYVLGADSHAMIAAGKFCVDKKVITVESSSVKVNSVPKEVVIEYLDETETSGTKNHEYLEGLSKLMHALSSIGSLDWPVKSSKYGVAVCPNLVIIDKISNEGTITFDIRAMLKSSSGHQVIIDLIREHFGKYGLDTSAKLILSIDPVDVNPDSEFPQLVKEISNVSGFPIQTVGEKLGGASDTRFFTSRGIDGIELGPLGHNMHGINEHVELSSIMKLIPIYQSIFKSLTQS